MPIGAFWHRNARFYSRAATNSDRRTYYLNCRSIMNLSLTQTMDQDFNVVIERDGEGYYVASVPGLPGCHTQARTLDELKTRIREAIELCLEAADDAVEPLDFIGVEKVTVAQ